MTNERDNLSEFRAAYLDYLEGYCDEPPAFDKLTDQQRRTAEGFIESITAARGVDPYASRPSIEQLLAVGARTGYSIIAIGESLQTQLRVDADPKALVMTDRAAAAVELASVLVIHARGLRVRVVMEPPSTDLEAVFADRIKDIAAVFGAFPDTSAVLYATTGIEPLGVIVDRGDVHSAIETPSGAIRPPRLRWPITDVETACTLWLMNAIPKFEPLNAGMFEARVAYDPPLDPHLLAAKVVHEVSAAGARARIQAKRATWSAIGEPEARRLAAIVDEAQRGPLSEEEYRRHFNNIVEMAA